VNDAEVRRLVSFAILVFLFGLLAFAALAGPGLYAYDDFDDEPGLPLAGLLWTQGPLLLLVFASLALLYVFRGGALTTWLQPQTTAQRATAHNEAGVALYERGGHAAAADEFAAALRLDPRHVEARVNRGTVRFELNDHDGALADYDEVLRLAPFNATAHARRGYVWLARGDLDRASADFTHAIDLDPNDPLPCKGRAAVWEARGQSQQALADLDRAIALGGDDPVIRHLRGAALLGLREHDRAIADLTEAIRWDPRLPGVWRDRGLAWLRKEDFARALADLDEALRLDPADGAAYNNRGYLFLRTGRFAKAAADLERALQHTPLLPHPYKNLAWLQATCPEAERRDGVRAVANITRALDLVKWQKPEWLPILAAAHAETGDLTSAVAVQRQALEAAPPETREGHRLALAAYEAGRPWREGALPC
jgi:tetratricopeptide (TPR) repeat protein